MYADADRLPLLMFSDRVQTQPDKQRKDARVQD